MPLVVSSFISVILVLGSGMFFLALIAFAMDPVQFSGIQNRIPGYVAFLILFVTASIYFNSGPLPSGRHPIKFQFSKRQKLLYRIIWLEIIGLFIVSIYYVLFFNSSMSYAGLLVFGFLGVYLLNRMKHLDDKILLDSKDVLHFCRNDGTNDCIFVNEIRAAKRSWFLDCFLLERGDKVDAIWFGLPHSYLLFKYVRMRLGRYGGRARGRG